MPASTLCIAAFVVAAAAVAELALVTEETPEETAEAAEEAVDDPDAAALPEGALVAEAVDAQEATVGTLMPFVLHRLMANWIIAVTH